MWCYRCHSAGHERARRVGLDTEKLAVTKALLWVRGLSTTVKLTMLAGVLLTGAVWQVQRWDRNRLTRAVATAVNTERAKVAQIVDAYAARILTLMARKDSIVYIVDTLRVAATRTASSVTVAIAAVPDVVRDSQPAVDSALTACETLVVDLDRLTTAHHTERVAWREMHDADTAMVRAQAVVMVAQRDTIAARTKERDKKPGWGTVGKVGGVLLAVGVGVGRWVLR